MTYLEAIVASGLHRASEEAGAMKRPEKRTRRLSLNKETLLELAKLEDVRGGANFKCQTNQNSCQLTFFCTRYCPRGGGDGQE